MKYRIGQHEVQFYSYQRWVAACNDLRYVTAADTSMYMLAFANLSHSFGKRRGIERHQRMLTGKHGLVRPK